MDPALRPYLCTFCQKSFKRRDVLKRHWDTCKARRLSSLDIPSVPSKPKGRKPKACDRCSRLKRACSATQPCSICTQLKKTCTYSRASSKAAYFNETGGDLEIQSGTNDVHVDGGVATSAHTPTMDALLESQSKNDVAFDGLAGTQLSEWQGSSLVVPASDAATTDYDIPRDGWMYSWPVSHEFSLARAMIRRPTELDVQALLRFPFLANFTKTTGFVKSFECGSREQRLKVMQERLGIFTESWQYSARLQQRNLELESQLIRRGVDYQADLWTDAYGISSLDPLSPFQASKPINETVLGGFVEGPVVDSVPGDWLPGPDSAFNVGTTQGSSPNFEDAEDSSKLIFKCHEIVGHIREITVNKPRGSQVNMTWCKSIELLCYQFFSPVKIQTLLSLFWVFWAPNCPMIHKPSFNPSKASSGLVAAMVLIGACLSPDDEDRTMANLLFNPIEEMIFNHSIFSHEGPPDYVDQEELINLPLCLELLQAAYCVVLYQTWEGCTASKRRIRRHRYNMIICVVRDIGVRTGTLKSVDTTDLTRFNWNEFILRESFIRFFAYIYNLDSAYAMFYRYPPRMSPSELASGLTAPEQCFQAESAEECFAALQSWRHNLGSYANMTIASILKLICDYEVNYDIEQLFSTLSVLNMFTLISAIYSMTFQAEATFVRDAGLSMIEMGLKNWKRLWPSPYRDDELTDINPSPDLRKWKRIGFTRYAPEYWLATNLILRRIRNQRPEEARAEIPNPSIETTDMRQMNILIKEFQSLRAPWSEAVV